jgi:lactam utilization protein B
LALKGILRSVRAIPEIRANVEIGAHPPRREMLAFGRQTRHNQ